MKKTIIAAVELMGLEVAILEELQKKAFFVELFNNNIPVKNLLAKHNFFKYDLTLTLDEFMQVRSDEEVMSSMRDIIETHHYFYTPDNIALIEKCWSLQKDLRLTNSIRKKRLMKKFLLRTCRLRLLIQHKNTAFSSGKKAA